MHGYLPRARHVTGFVAAGAGVRSGVALERVRLIDVAPTAARLLGVPAPAVEGRVLDEILREPAQLFDTHTHLHFPEYADDRGGGAGARPRGGGGRHGDRRHRPRHRRGGHRAGRGEEPDVWASVGVHPHDAARADAAVFTEIERLARAPRVVAVGEIGLDFFRDLSPRDVQLTPSASQLELARRAARPVVIHCRDAHPETLAILSEARVGESAGSCTASPAMWTWPGAVSTWAS